jgi:hypothetical protein
MDKNIPISCVAPLWTVFLGYTGAKGGCDSPMSVAMPLGPFLQNTQTVKVQQDGTYYSCLSHVLCQQGADLFYALYNVLLLLNNLLNLE